MTGPPAPGPPCPSPSHGFKFAALASPSLASLSSSMVWLCSGKSASHVSVLLHEAHRGRTVTKKINFNSTMSGKTGSGSVSAKEKEKSDREKQKEKEKLAKEKTERDRRGKRSESILGGPARNDTKDKDNLNDVFHDGFWVKMNLSCELLYGL